MLPCSEMRGNSAEAAGEHPGLCKPDSPGLQTQRLSALLSTALMQSLQEPRENPVYSLAFLLKPTCSLHAPYRSSHLAASDRPILPSCQFTDLFLSCGMCPGLRPALKALFPAACCLISGLSPLSPQLQHLRANTDPQWSALLWALGSLCLLLTSCGVANRYK